MKPFEISMDFLLKSRENRALLESLLDRMEGAELNLDDIGAQNELRDWNRAAHVNQMFSSPMNVHEREEYPRGSDAIEYDPLEEKYPSLRHVREQKEYYQPTEEELRMREIEDNNARRMKQGEEESRDLDREYMATEHVPIEQQIKNAIARFKESDAGQVILEDLMQQLKERHISKVTGIAPPQYTGGALFQEGKKDPNQPRDMRPTIEDQMLIHALKTGDSSILDRYQTKTDNPLIGDLSLQDFERFYPTEMAVPQLGASAISPDVHLDWLQELKDEHQRLNPTPSVAVEQPLSTKEKIVQEYHDEMNERYPSSIQQPWNEFVATLPENQSDWTDEETKRYMSSLFG